MDQDTSILMVDMTLQAPTISLDLPSEKQAMARYQTYHARGIMVAGNVRKPSAKKRAENTNRTPGVCASARLPLPLWSFSKTLSLSTAQHLIITMMIIIMTRVTRVINNINNDNNGNDHNNNSNKFT